MTYLMIPAAKHLPPRVMRGPVMAGLGRSWGKRGGGFASAARRAGQRAREEATGETQGAALELTQAAEVEPDPVEIDWGDESAPPSGQVPGFPTTPKSNNKALLIGGGLLAAAGLVATVVLLD